jgi:hypothetical protein
MFTSYMTRQKQRAESKARKEAYENHHKEVLARIPKIVEKINESFKFEQELMYNNIIKSWRKAKADLQSVDGNRKSYIIEIMGKDLTPKVKEPSYADLMVKYPSTRFDNTPEYKEYKLDQKRINAIYDDFHKSLAGILFVRSLWHDEGVIDKAGTPTKQAFENYIHKDATDYVDAQRYKLEHAISSKLGHYTRITVLKSRVKRGAKGFEGVFTLYTDQGLRVFKCWSIMAEGEIQRLHYRYLSNVKTYSK